MDKFTPAQSLIRCRSFACGNAVEQRDALQSIIIGAQYTLQSSNIRTGGIDVVLEEVPDKVFPASMFENVEPISEEDRKKHPQYKTYK